MTLSMQIVNTIMTSVAYVLAGMFLEQQFHPVDKFTYWLAEKITVKN